MFGKCARHGKYRFLFFVSLLVGEGSFGLQKAKVYYCLHSLLSLLVRHRTLGFIYLQLDNGRQWRYRKVDVTGELV
jgi:hypothetical protein